MPNAQQWAAVVAVGGSLSVTVVAIINAIDVWYWTPRREQGIG